jgi:hypothetical protein
VFFDDEKAEIGMNADEDMTGKRKRILKLGLTETYLCLENDENCPDTMTHPPGRVGPHGEQDLRLLV